MFLVRIPESAEKVLSWLKSRNAISTTFDWEEESQEIMYVMSEEEYIELRLNFPEYKVRLF